jgi:predicted dithiol-disulfide oxidoreductase (DUF899 family)
VNDYVLPGETPEYERSRKALQEAEMALRDQIERVAQMRRSLPLGKPMPDYVFREGPPDLSRNDPTDFREVRLSELFDEGHDALIVDHLMFHPDDESPCIMCSMWADGYNAIAPHIRQRASFVIVAKAEIGKLRRWARERGWDRIRLLSSHDSTFNRDMHMESEDGGQEAGLSVFTRDESGTVHHRYTISADLNRGDLDLYQGEGRGIDLYTPVWHLFDLLPAGRGDDWYPGHHYMERRAIAAGMLG